MTKIKIILIIFFIDYSLIEANMSTSVIVPCHYKHVKHLSELFQAYEKQIDLPNEIVVSISEANQVEPNIIESLKNTEWLFPVKLLLSNKKMFAGQNRNVACQQTTGEIIVCQDADDLPHPQRIKIIKYFFNKFNLNFLLHKFVYNNENEMKQLRTIDNFDSIKHSFIKTYHEAWIVGYMLFGQPAIHRNVFKKIKWPDVPVGEDNAFDSKVITTFDRCMMIHCPLYIYRFENSVTPYELYKKQFNPKRSFIPKQRYKLEILYS